MTEAQSGPLATRLRVLARTQTTLEKAEAKSLAAGHSRDATLLDAQEAGASYAELEAATGLSSSRVTQVLRRERKRRATTH